MFKKKIITQYDLEGVRPFEPAEDLAKKYLKNLHDELYKEIVDLGVLLFTVFMKLDAKARADIENLLSWMGDGFAKELATQWFKIAEEEHKRIQDETG